MQQSAPATGTILHSMRKADGPDFHQRLTGSAAFKSDGFVEVQWGLGMTKRLAGSDSSSSSLVCGSDTGIDRSWRSSSTVNSSMTLFSELVMATTAPSRVSADAVVSWQRVSHHSRRDGGRFGRKQNSISKTPDTLPDSSTSSKAFRRAASNITRIVRRGPVGGSSTPTLKRSETITTRKAPHQLHR